MTHKISLSLDERSFNIINTVASELDIKKNEFIKKAVLYYADIVKTVKIQERLKEVKAGSADIISLEQLEKEINES